MRQIIIKKKFGTGEGNKRRFSDEVWDPEERLSMREDGELDKPFTKKEIKNVIDQMLTNKAPGPVGIPIEFIKLVGRLLKTKLWLFFMTSTGVRLVCTG